MTEQDKNVYLMLGTDDEKKRPSVICGEVNNAICVSTQVSRTSISRDCVRGFWAAL